MAWYIGQSLPMMAIAFLVGLLVGYLLWGRRYRRLEQAEAVRAVDPATVLPHRGSAATAAPAAAAAPVAAVAEADEHEAEHDEAEADDAELDADDEHDEADETEVAVVEAADDDGPVETTDEADDDEATDVEDADDDADDDEAAGDASGEPAAEAAVAVEAVDESADEDDDQGDAEPPTAEQIAAQAEPQSLFAAAGQPEPAAPAPVSTSDRLEQIEGIGPKIALALRTAGIRTFEDLAGADESTLRDALADANLRFAPSLTTWAQQARLLADGDHEGHAALTQQLVAGRAPKAQ